MTFQYKDAFVTLAAVEFETLVRFYTQLLHQEPSSYRENVYAEFQLGRFQVGIFKPKVMHQAEFENAAGSSMSLCLEVEDLEGAIAHLTRLGYPPPGKIITTSHGREIYAYDPANNRLIVHQSN
ncbi:MAG: VOC family protein [Potamolinea sp.]